VRAVDGVRFTVARGETLGLVGESGCGKTTTGARILRLIEPTAGTVRFDGADVRALDAGALRACARTCRSSSRTRSRRSTRMTVGATMREGLTIHRLAEGARADRACARCSTRWGSARSTRALPARVLGGQRQRIGNRARLRVEPKLIVCDEPVSALDVSCRRRW
jgi:peptide/nickel transport system ATP-binding protein/oligopeptide transport system ATP-binding protein